MAGDTAGFMARLPGYSGFTVSVGAPAALLTGALGGAETMAYRLSSAPGLLALAALGVAVAAPVRAAGRRGWPIFLLFAAGDALTLETLKFGHPEDLLAAACAVGGVLAARGGRTVWASALIVAAVVAKQWAVLAILPAALAAPRAGLRIAAAGVIGAAALLLVQTQAGAPAARTPRSRTPACSSTRSSCSGRWGSPRRRSSPRRATAPRCARRGSRRSPAR